MASPAGIRTIRTLTSFASGPVSKYPQRSLRRHIWNPPTKIPELVVDLRTHWPHHIYKGAVPEMDHRETYLLCFPDFPRKSFELKDLGLSIAYLIDSKR